MNGKEYISLNYQEGNDGLPRLIPNKKVTKTDMDDILIINDKEQLERYLAKYDCKDEKELDDVLWFTYGVTLKLNIKEYKI